MKVIKNIWLDKKFFGRKLKLEKKRIMNKTFYVNFTFFSWISGKFECNFIALFFFEKKKNSAATHVVKTTLTISNIFLPAKKDSRPTWTGDEWRRWSQASKFSRHVGWSVSEVELWGGECHSRLDFRACFDSKLLEVAFNTDTTMFSETKIHWLINLNYSAPIEVTEIKHETINHWTTHIF